MKGKEDIYVGIVELNRSGNWTFLNGRPAKDLMYKWFTGEKAYTVKDDTKCATIFRNQLWPFFCDKQ